MRKFKNTQVVYKMHPILQSIPTYFAYTSVGVILLYLLPKLFIYLYRYFRLRWCFPGPKLVSFLGHGVRELGEKDLKKLEAYVKEYPRMHRLINGPIAEVVVVCPELLAEVYRSSPDNTPLLHHVLKDWQGEGLIVTSGEIWKRSRPLLTPIFRNEFLEGFCNIFNKTGDSLVQQCTRYVDKGPFDFAPVVRMATFEATINGVCAKDSQVQKYLDSYNKEKNYLQLVDQLSDRLVARISKLIYLSDFIYYRTQAGKMYLKACRDLKTLVGEYIRERREQDDEKKRDPQTMLDIMMKLRDDKGVGLTDPEMINEINTFFSAGFKNATSGILFLIYCLVTHPDWQEKCREEINKVLGDRTNIEWEDLPKLTCVTNCLNESLRLYSPVTLLRKVLNKPITLDQWTLPSGTSVDIGIQSVHMNPTVWENPMQYNPDRFNRNDLHPFSFIPFSAGSRQCIARHFALSEMKILVCKVLREFEFTLAPGYQLVRETRALLVPKDGLLVSVKPIGT